MDCALIFGTTVVSTGYVQRLKGELTIIYGMRNDNSVKIHWT